MISETATPKHYPGLDVLRGIAVLLVVAFHVFAFSPGWMGVDLFFVLSGFLITKNLLDAKERPGYFRRFFIHRILRIFPLYFFVLILFYAAAPILFSNKEPGSVYASYEKHQAWFWTFTQNWLFIKEGLLPEPYLQHFWSLAVEEQFYLIWPFLVYAVKDTFALQKIFIGLFLLALTIRFLLWFYPVGHQPFYYSTPARMDSLCAGAFLATLVFLKRKLRSAQIIFSAVSFAIVLCFSYVFYDNVRYDNAVFATVGYSFSAVFFMAACYLMILNPTILKPMNFFSFFGRISYGIYVYHVPVFLLVLFALLAKAQRFFSSPRLTGLFIAFTTLALTLFISVVSYRMLERPFLKLKKRFDNAVS